MSNGKHLVSYQFNDDGIRTQKVIENSETGAAVTTDYILDGNDVVYESDGTNKIHYTYDSGDQLLGLNINGLEYSYLYNVQGDIIGILNAEGTEVVKYQYDAWGNTTISGSLASTVGKQNPYRYRGYRFDEETGWYYLQSRYYVPEIGRFLSSDSLVDTGYDLLGHNMFAYCNNNPVMNEDKNGDVAWWVGAAAVGAAWDVGSYLWKNRNKGYSWKGIGKSALKGAVTGVAFGGAGKIASKVLVKSGKIFKANNGYGFFAKSKKVNLLYENPSVKGGTFIAKKTKPKFRLEWDSQYGYHAHWGKTNKLLDQHRSLRLWSFGKPK